MNHARRDSFALPAYAELVRLPTSRSCMGRRAGRNSSFARRNSATRVSPSPMSVRSPASSAPSRRRRKRETAAYHRSYFRLVGHADKRPAFGLFACPEPRRLRQPVGTHHPRPDARAQRQLSANAAGHRAPREGPTRTCAVPNCLAILIPDFPAKEEALAPQLEWMNATFPLAAWVGLTLTPARMDDIHRGTVEYLASRYLVPVVATGNVVMHVRSRKPLQDTMTAIRLGKPSRNAATIWRPMPNNTCARACVWRTCIPSTRDRNTERAGALHFLAG